MKYLLIPFIVCCLLFACSKKNEIPAGLALGQSIVVDGVFLKFVGVTDSRCCCLCLCIWEGVGTVTLANTTDTVRLHTLDRGEFSTTTTFRDKTLRLLSLNPYPCEGEPDNQDDYRLNLEVE
ncbi:MAG: hypothetical protein AAGA31_14230 [Bacteroidota bacterium]